MTGIGIFFLILFLIIVTAIITSYTLYKFPNLIKDLISYKSKLMADYKNNQIIKAETLAKKQKLQEEEKSKEKSKENENSIVLMTNKVLEIQEEYKTNLTKINDEEKNKTIRYFSDKCPYFKKYFEKSIYNFHKKNSDNFITLCNKTLTDDQKSISSMKICNTVKLTEDWANYNLLLKTICNDIDNVLYSPDIDNNINLDNKTTITAKSDNLYDIAKKITCYNTNDLNKVKNSINNAKYTNTQDYGKHFLLYANPDDINDIENITYDIH